MNITISDTSSESIYYSFKIDTDNIMSNYGYATWNSSNINECVGCDDKIDNDTQTLFDCDGYPFCRACFL
jgi:hypothetical protein